MKKIIGILLLLGAVSLLLVSCDPPDYCWCNYGEHGRRSAPEKRYNFNETHTNWVHETCYDMADALNAPNPDWNWRCANDANMDELWY